MKDLVNLVPISNQLQTNYHLKELLAVIDSLQAEIFKKIRSPLDIITKDVPFPLSEELKKLAQEHEADLASSVDADMFLEKLREAVIKLPVLTISVGIPPTLDLIKDVNSWVVTNVKGFVVLDFVQDKSLIAGAIIGYAGKTRDYSVKKQTTGVSTVNTNELTVRNRE